MKAPVGQLLEPATGALPPANPPKQAALPDATPQIHPKAISRNFNPEKVSVVYSLVDG